mgnify:CR=1 FL=1
MISISRNKIPTETGKKLYDLLVKSWNDTEFIYGTLMLLRGDEQKQKMIDLIEIDGIDDSDTIILATLDIRDGLI